MATALSTDAKMIGNFILLRAFSATLTADAHSLGDARQVFHETLLDALIEIEPAEFPDEIADTIRMDVKTYITKFLDGVSDDVERITNGLLITEEPRVPLVNTQQ